jgi:two-component system chemotaxis response regulator CheB
MTVQLTQRNMRDIIVIGASAGGVPALSEIVQALPHDLPAAVFVVLHVAANGRSVLGPLLDRISPLPIRTAEDRAAIELGTVHIAPQDRHMTLEPEQVRVSFGPLQNRNRPSIDVLFRSAALSHGPRVIGVVLTGFLSDGTAGLLAIKQRGGLAVVQDPDSASFPDMPANALRAVDVDHCVPLAEIPSLLTRLTAPLQGEGLPKSDRRPQCSIPFCVKQSRAPPMPQPFDRSWACPGPRTMADPWLGTPGVLDIGVSRWA